MSKKNRSEAMAAIHEAMEALYDAGAIDKQTMRRFDDACLS
jgi:putative transcriptional regulator